MCSCDFESPTLYRARVVRARKAHRCQECCRAICKGDQYEQHTGMFDGIFYSGKTCQRCLDLRQYIETHAQYFCFSHGNLIDDAWDELREWGWPDGTGILFGALRRLHACVRPRTRGEDV